VRTSLRWSLTLIIGGAENAGVENAGAESRVENAGVVMRRNPSEEIP